VTNVTWRDVDNQSTHNDNYTFDNTSSGLNTNKTLYFWVMDNATNISPVGSDSIEVLSDTSVPTITSAMVVNNVSPDLRNATYTNSATVTIEINAEDNESGLAGYYITTDNSTAPTEDNKSSATSWAGSWITTGFMTDGNSGNFTISDNFSFTFDNVTNDNKSVYVYVKNTQDNVSVYTANAFDWIILDNSSPSDNGTPVLTGAVDGTSNTTYTDNLTVTLDNLTSWMSDTPPEGTASSGVYSYFVTDNSSRDKDNITSSSGWTTLDNLTFIIGSQWSSDTADTTLGDTTLLDNKTLYVWARDNASNVSDNYTAVSIFFDNETPTISSFSIYDSSDDNTSYTNSDNISFRLRSSDNGSGVSQYFITDNASYSSNGSVSAPWQTDNASNSGDGGWKALGSPSDNFTGTFQFDNATNESKTLYVHIVDKAGQLSTVDTQSIVFDNVSPIIRNVVDNGSAGLFGSDNLADNITLVFTVDDNSTTYDNASGLKEFYLSYQAVKSDLTTAASHTATDDNVSGASGWTAVNSTNLSGFGSGDNNSRYLKNVEFTVDLSSLNLDNDSVVNFRAWFRDNASNISDNYSTPNIKLDNSTD